MFYNCEKLERINLSNFDTTNAKEYNDLFCLCGNIKEIITNDKSNIDNIKNQIDDALSKEKI